MISAACPVDVIGNKVQKGARMFVLRRVLDSGSIAILLLVLHPWPSGRMAAFYAVDQALKPGQVMPKT